MDAVLKESRVRLIDVARAAGVHRTVVGKVLLGGDGRARYSQATAELVRRAARKLNYRPNRVARQLKGIRANVIGTLIGGARVGYERLTAIEHAAYDRGYRLMIGQVCGGEAQAKAYLDDFQSRGIDGLLYLAHPVPLSLQPQLAGRCVVFNTDPGIRGACFVELDRAAGVRMAVDHLVERGRQRPAMVLSDMAWKTSVDRKHGFITACRAHGLTQYEKRIHVLDCSGERVEPECLEAAIARLVHQQHADSLVMNNDIWAVRMIKALRRHAVRVPEDVAVVGFDNLPIAETIDPELTTLDQAHDLFAAAAMDLMLRLIEQGHVPPAERGVVIPPRLVVRAST